MVKTRSRKKRPEYHLPFLRNNILPFGKIQFYSYKNMRIKGAIAEIFSRALYHEKADHYLVGYLDFGAIKEVSLPEFIRLSENFGIIPASRIAYIKNGNEVVYQRDGKKDPRNHPHRRLLE